MLIIVIVNCSFLYMGASSTIFKPKILAHRVAVGAGQVAVRSATRRTAASGPMRRTAVAVQLSSPAIRRPIGRSRGLPSDRGGRADRRVGSGRALMYIRRTARPSASLLLFPLPWQELVRSSIWLVLKTIHWPSPWEKGKSTFQGGGNFLLFAGVFFK
jgi:hypothetical protein